MDNAILLGDLNGILQKTAGTARRARSNDQRPRVLHKANVKPTLERAQERIRTLDEVKIGGAFGNSFSSDLVAAVTGPMGMRGL